jgi:hypothetical protein
MGAGVLVYLLAWLAAVLLALLVGAALLRAAVAAANRTVGPVRRAEPIGWDWDADEEDEDPVRPAEVAIPEPGLSTGMLILFLVGLAVLTTAFLLDSPARRALGLTRRDAEALALVLVPGVWFLTLAGTTAAILPTAFRRAALVALYFSLILVAIGAVVYVLLAAAFG